MIERESNHYLEAIYNAVVGVHEENASGFERDHGEPGKIGIPELGKLILISKQMLSRGGNSNSQITFLENVASASLKYMMLLNGEIDIIKKDATNIGNRHTLMRGDGGKIYEMTNSMTANEVEFFRKKTNMNIGAVEKPISIKTKDNNCYSKIEMGSGSFGKTRIARNINDDTFVAVKKIHPKIKASTWFGFFSLEPKLSNFDQMSDEKQRALKSISEYVISPDDACQMHNRHSLIAQTLNNSADLSSAEVGLLMGKHDLFKKILLDSADDVGHFLSEMGQGRFAGPGVIQKSRYVFSELGVSTVSAVVEKFNVLRTYFESKKGLDLSEDASNLLQRYHTKYHHLGDIAGADSLDGHGIAYRTLAAIDFESDSFKLKDPVYNQKFLNTLGKKMLLALSKLNDCDLTHQDIKSNNMVFCQNNDGMISVKLIDIDFIKDKSRERKQPDSGTPLYMPPEAFNHERDGSVSYTGEKGDAYAMGLTLREIFGFSCVEITGLSQLQKDKVATDRSGGRQDRRRQIALQREIDFIGDFKVQNQSRIKAIEKVAPNALSLKDMADLMLKENPGKRYSAKEVLTNYSFFKNQKNLLNDAEFSDHFHKIYRLGSVTSDEETEFSSDGNPSGVNRLVELRQSAMKDMILARSQDMAGYHGGSLSKSEATKVKIAEKEIQIRAGVRRISQSMADFCSPPITDADKANSYKSRR